MTAEAIRYYNRAKEQREKEQAEKAEAMNRNRSASQILANPGQRTTVEVPTATREVIPKVRAEAIATDILLTKAREARAAIENELKWIGVEVKAGDGKTGKPFPDYPHMQETVVSIIPLSNDAALIVSMANFKAQKVGVRPDGSLHYQGVAKPKDGDPLDEMTYPVRGIRRDADGQFKIDPGFTEGGQVWTKDNIEVVTKACANAVIKSRQHQPGQRPEPGQTPDEPRPDFAALRAQQAEARQHQRREPAQRDHGMTL